MWQPVSHIHHHSGDPRPHQPIAQVTSIPLGGLVAGYELQELRAKHPRVTPNVESSQSHSHPIAQDKSTYLEEPVVGYKLWELRATHSRATPSMMSSRSRSLPHHSQGSQLQATRESLGAGRTANHGQIASTPATGHGLQTVVFTMLRALPNTMRTRIPQLSRYLEAYLTTSCDPPSSHDLSTSTPAGYEQPQPPQATIGYRSPSHGLQDQGHRIDPLYPPLSLHLLALEEIKLVMYPTCDPSYDNQLHRCLS